MRVEYPSADELFEIVQSTLDPPKPLWESFQEWYSEQKRQEISIRQAISLVSYAMSAMVVENDGKKSIETAAAGIFREKTGKQVGS